jgi:Cu(I)/Ag(I) efflux system periplasmic protein CusF
LNHLKGKAMKKLLLTAILVFLTLPAMVQDNRTQPMAGMKMDKPATADAIAALPEGQGKINSIDSEKYSVNITHEPIEALKRPGMTMDFAVAKEVHLSGFKAGDSVTFTLKQGDDGSYIIVALNGTEITH